MKKVKDIVEARNAVIAFLNEFTITRLFCMDCSNPFVHGTKPSVIELNQRKYDEVKARVTNLVDTGETPQEGEVFLYAYVREDERDYVEYYRMFEETYRFRCKKHLVVQFGFRGKYNGNFFFSTLIQNPYFNFIFALKGEQNNGRRTHR